MGLLRTIANWLSPPPAAVEPTRATVVDDRPWTLRRWDAARTDRHNKAHWARATGQPINADLAGHLPTLRARCAHEASNNPIVEGLLNSHATDIVGRHGPTLQVISDSDEYNTAVEQLWRQWFNPPDDGPVPDAAGILSGPDLLRQCVPQWWTKGEHLWQLVTAPDVPNDSISLRILALDPDRLATAPAHAGDPAVALGVRRNRLGQPTGYQIAEETASGPYRLLGVKYNELGADEIIHQFEQLEPGQVRGVPWLASALDLTADLREFDRQVLDAARLAASQGIVWYTDHPDATYFEVNETTEMARNVERTGPPGWKPQMVDSKQPQANYVDYRTERLRELGRGKSIPLMKILLGSERHNFASARMDNLNYQRACETLQTWTARGTLMKLLAAVLREGQLLRRRGRFVLPPRPAGGVAFIWHWAKQPKVDPVKEETATRLGLENGTLPFAEACAADGRDEDEVIASRARTARKLEAAGLPPVPVATTSVAVVDDPADPTAPADKRTGRDGAGTREIDPADDGYDIADDLTPDPEEVLDDG